MTPQALVASFSAGFVYGISPGPAVLAMFTLTALSGRKHGARFIGAHLFGDTVWCSLAILAIVGVSQLGHTLFDVLGVACGLYLIWLGWQAIRQSGDAETTAIGAINPARTGFLFGITNPKAYPVAVAMFTALTAPFASSLTWSDAPAFMLAAIVGFVLAYALLLWMAGLSPIRNVVSRHHRIITRITGAMFVLFGAKSVFDVFNAVRSRA
ncbi:LysE family translocator [Flaviflagellibacter deserti]|uniref:LysE family translocator n=1 Tax=Flaviflagellibacter deserti TaxID=2267266 RepID=A0ABV9Z6M2_9HYPH